MSTCFFTYMIFCIMNTHKTKISCQYGIQSKRYKSSLRCCVWKEAVDEGGEELVTSPRHCVLSFCSHNLRLPYQDQQIACSTVCLIFQRDIVCPLTLLQFENYTDREGIGVARKSYVQNMYVHLACWLGTCAVYKR